MDLAGVEKSESATSALKIHVESCQKTRNADISLILICFHSYTATTNKKFVGSSGI